MSPSQSTAPQSRTLLLATDCKNSVLTEMAGPINHLAYTPYGQQSSRQKVMTRLGFNGELCETSRGWYILGKGYRAYNPRLMRFHNPDKFSPFDKGGLNAYLYCGGEPVMRADPSGEGWVFNAFATVMNILSPVGPSGRVASSTSPRPGGVLGALYLIGNTPKAPVKLGRGSRNASKTSKPTRNQNVPGPQFNSPTNPKYPDAKSNQVPQPTSQPTTHGGGRPGHIIDKGNYDARDNNVYSTEKSRDGVKIQGVNSGRAQMPSTSAASKIRRR
ncbi:RHS repeat-associated core domain-containing protein [Pseudomonas sp. LB3P31]